MGREEAKMGSRAWITALRKLVSHEVRSEGVYATASRDSGSAAAAVGRERDAPAEAGARVVGGGPLESGWTAIDPLGLV